MIDFIVKFISKNSAILLSLLALGVSGLSFSISRRSFKLSEKNAEDAKKLKAFEQRAKILEVIDKKNAKLGNLQSILVEQHLQLINDPQLANKYPDEIERILDNIKCSQNIRSQYEVERKNVEAFDDKVNIPYNESILADAKRLLIHIDEDIIKEERRLNILRDELTK